MKNFTGNSLVLILSVLVIACTDSKYQTLPEEEVNVVQKDFAESIATDILNGMKSGEFKELGNESILSMQKGLSAEKQKMSYEQIKGLFGNFKSISYYETCVPKASAFHTVYRFKGKFESSEFPEVRVVINKDNKLSGFWIKPWNDTLQ